MEDKVEAAPAIYRQPFLSLARLTPGSTDRIIIVVWTGIMTEARTSLNELVCVYVCACVFFSSSSSSFFFPFLSIPRFLAPLVRRRRTNGMVFKHVATRLSISS